MDKRYIKDFLLEENAVEAIEWLAILAVCSVLIGIAATMAKTIKAKMSNIGNIL